MKFVKNLFDALVRARQAAYYARRGDINSAKKAMN